MESSTESTCLGFRDFAYVNFDQRASKLITGLKTRRRLTRREKADNLLMSPSQPRHHECQTCIRGSVKKKVAFRGSRCILDRTVYGTPCWRSLVAQWLSLCIRCLRLSSVILRFNSLFSHGPKGLLLESIRSRHGNGKSHMFKTRNVFEKGADATQKLRCKPSHHPFSASAQAIRCETETHFYENNFDAKLPLAAGEGYRGGA